MRFVTNRTLVWISLATVVIAISFGRVAAQPQSASSAASASGYHLLKKVVLGGEGGWDYLSADPTSHHVFISRGSYVMVTDADGNVLGKIDNLKGTHGAAIAPEFNVGYTSDGGSNSVTMFDLKTLATIRAVNLPNAQGPDGFLYDPVSKRVFIFSARSMDATAIDAKTGQVAGSVPLGGKPEAAQADSDGHVYVNVEDKDQILAFDAKALKVLGTWPTAPCTAPGGLAIDVSHKHLWIGCHNNMMAVMDYTNGKMAGQVPIPPGVDASSFDPGTGFAFSSTGSGDGAITVAKENPAGTFNVVDTIATMAGARTMTVDTGNHRLYTVTAEQLPAPPPTPDNPRPRPTNKPDTFTLLIYGR